MRFLSAFLLFLLLGVSFVYGGQSDSILGKYIIQEGCGDSRQCCCIQGRITISGTDGAATVTAASELRAVCPGGETNPPTFSGSLTKTKEGYTATTTIRGESFSILLSSDKLSFQNNANKGTTCSFAARRIPSNSDEGKPCKNPTKEQVNACINNWNNLPACEKGQEKDINTATCCPVCRPGVIPPRPKCSMEDIDRCGTNEKPVFNNATGCPSCVVAAPGKDCPNADVIPSVVCPPGVPPSRTANSCVSCKETKDSRKCSKEQQKACEIAIDQKLIPVCASGVESTFNITTCCRTCIKPDDNDEGPKNKEKCTKDEMNACMAAVPVCQDGEKPFANKTKCCPSCRRPERGCKLSDVTTCKAAQRVCASGELPSHIDGECCATCKLAPPTCTPACNSTSICVPNVAPGATADQIQNAVGKCLPKRSIKAKFNLIAAGAGYDGASVAAILTEIINRYCDKAENADKCAQLTAILNAITVKLNSADITSGNVDATIEISNQVPSGDSSPSSASFSLLSYQQFKLLATGDAETIVTAALNDPSAVDTVTVTSVSVDNGSQSGAADHYPSIIVAAVAVLFAFLKY